MLDMKARVHTVKVRMTATELAVAEQNATAEGVPLATYLRRLAVTARPGATNEARVARALAVTASRRGGRRHPRERPRGQEGVGRWSSLTPTSSSTPSSVGDRVPDTLIAAMCIENGHPLLTRNRKHFEHFLPFGLELA